MARSSAARKMAVVHPASESRIERAANELDEVRRAIKDLELKKDELNARLLLMVKREGEADHEGKVRYETDLHKFQIIPGKNVQINEGKLRASMVAMGLTPAKIEKAIAPAKTVTEYEYVGVYLAKPKDEEKVGA